MKMALIPALIASMFAVGGAMAADKELLFGPTGVVKDVPAKQSTHKSVAVAADPVDAPVVARVKKTKQKATQDTQDGTVAVQKPVTAPMVVKAPEAPVVVAVKPAPAPAPTPVAKPTPAPVVVAVKPAPIPAPVVVAAKPAPVVEVKPAAPVVTAAVPAMPAMPFLAAVPSLQTLGSPVKVDEGSDPLVIREMLQQKLKQEISVGFFPSAGGNGSTYAFLRSYLPLANLLSQKTGVLVNFLPERNLSQYSKRITNQQYPVIFINAALAREAIAAGYEPVAVGDEKLAPGFVVDAKSPLKSIDDIKNVKVSWSRNAQISFLAMGDLAKRGIAGTNKYSDVGSAGRVGALAAVKTGTADVAVLRSSEADAAAEQSGGQLRSLGAGTAAPSSGMWIRKDLIGTEFAKRLEAAIVTVDPESSDVAAKRASEAFSAGFGVRGKFIQESASFSKEMGDLLGSAQSAFPESFPEILVNPKELAANLAIPAIAAVEKSELSDTLAERQKIAKKLKEQIAVGFFPSVTGNGTSYAFMRNFLPLSNILSQKSGVLVNLVPERNLAEYGKRIIDQQYPVIFINATAAREAIAAGYTPIAVGVEKFGPAYVVNANSPLKNIGDVKNVRVVWSRNSATAFLTMGDFAKAGIARTNKYSDVGLSGRSGALNALKAGSADVAVVRSNEVDALVQQSNGEFRSLGLGTQEPSSGMWVRKDLVGSDFIKKMESALLTLTPDSSDPVIKQASELFSVGFGVRGEFKPVPATLAKELGEIATAAEADFPDAFTPIVPNEKAKAANLAIPVFERIR
jgi:ABC-type phosphate/phosphonate transport system substrate-binding protein